jgi:hypothetical protein
MIAKKIDPKSKADPNAASKNELKSIPIPEILHFQSFDPAHKRTEATVKNSEGKARVPDLRSKKGSTVGKETS